MRTNPEFQSDEFESIDDPDFFVDIDYLDDQFEGDAQFDVVQRHRAAWQILEERLEQRQLRTEFEDWDDWDEFLVTH